MTLNCMILSYPLFYVRYAISGKWEDDKASGFGSLEYSNGDLYEGDWENDQRNGTYVTVQCSTVCTVLTQQDHILCLLVG